MQMTYEVLIKLHLLGWPSAERMVPKFHAQTVRVQSRPRTQVFFLDAKC